MSLDEQTPTQDKSQTVIQKLPVSFYVLSDTKAQDILGFICQLTQTALNKSDQSLILLIDDEAFMAVLDEALWTHDVISFIPHQLLKSQSTDDLIAPVLLADYLPTQFKDIVLNTTSRTVNDFIASTDNTLPTRILEIIKPDAISIEQGRAKYRQYQQLGYELSYFKI